MAGDVEMPTVRRTLRRWLRRGLVIVIGTWFGVCAGLYFMQDGMLFPRHMVRHVSGEPRIAGVEVLERALPGGGKVVAWYVPATGGRTDRAGDTSGGDAAWARRLNGGEEENAPDRAGASSGGAGGTSGGVVVYCHGNAELIDDQAFVVEAYRAMGFAVLLPEYRGYGRSGGEPSQAGIGEDFAWFVDRILERGDVDRDRVVMHGRSLGAAVAVDLAERRKPAALILEAPFRSVVSMAHGYGAPGFLVKHPYRTDRVLPALGLPTLIFHGRDDRVVSVEHGRALANMTPTAEYHERAGGHNDLPTAAQWQTVEQFLKAHAIITPPTHEEDQR